MTHEDKEYVDILSAGIIIFSDSLNESEINYKNSRIKPKKIGECKVEVYGSEGPIPHFHIYNKDKSFNCCIRIYDNHFFSHGNKYRDILNTSQCRELDEWLRQINDKSLVPMTNWQAIVYMWEAANGECKYPESKKVKVQPDYTKINTFKDII